MADLFYVLEFVINDESCTGTNKRCLTLDLLLLDGSLNGFSGTSTLLGNLLLSTAFIHGLALLSLLCISVINIALRSGRSHLAVVLLHGL